MVFALWEAGVLYGSHIFYLIHKCAKYCIRYAFFLKKTLKRMKDRLRL